MKKKYSLICLHSIKMLSDAYRFQHSFIYKIPYPISVYPWTQNWLFIATSSSNYRNMCAVLLLCKYSNYCMNNIMNMLPGNKKPQNDMLPIIPYMVMNPLSKHSNWLRKHKTGNNINRNTPRFHCTYMPMTMTLDSLTRSTLRGYCTPGQFLDCFSIFLKNYNTLVTSKICFV